MTTSSATWTEERLHVAGGEMQVLKGGSGDPLLVLHDEMGQPGWLQMHEELAKELHGIRAVAYRVSGSPTAWTG